MWGRPAALEVLVRVNALDTQWGFEDLRFAAGLGVDGVLLPKVEGDAVVRQAQQVLAEATTHPPAAALSVGAGKLDLASQQHRQFATDGQSKPSSTVFAGRACIGLLEGFEYQSLLLRRDADTGVLDREGKNVVDGHYQGTTFDEVTI